MENNINLTLTLNVELGESAKQFLSALFGTKFTASDSAAPATAFVAKLAPSSAPASAPSSAPASAPSPAPKLEIPSVDKTTSAINDKMVKEIKALMKDKVNEHRDEILEIVAKNSVPLAAGEKPSIKTIAITRYDEVCKAIKGLE